MPKSERLSKPYSVSVLYKIFFFALRRRFIRFGIFIRQDGWIGFVFRTPVGAAHAATILLLEAATSGSSMSSWCSWFGRSLYHRLVRTRRPCYFLFVYLSRRVRMTHLIMTCCRMTLFFFSGGTMISTNTGAFSGHQHSSTFCWDIADVSMR